MSEHERVFLARGGKGGEDEEYALENGLAIIGWEEVPSLARAQSYEEVRQVVETTFPGKKPRAIGNWAGQLWAFAVAMQKDDLVVLPQKLTSQIAIGRVSGPYKYQNINGRPRHTRQVEWLRTDVPRTDFKQDLLYSFGAFMTVCQITRHDAEARVAAVLAGQVDPGFTALLGEAPTEADIDADDDSEQDLAQLAEDQIVRQIRLKFKEHALARLVDALLQADGWVTKLSPPGPDGGADILAGRGSLGLDQPRLVVQVKSQATAADVTVYRTLQGTMQTFKADQGLLVCWGGFNKVVLAEARANHFGVRLWEVRDIVEAVYRNYEKLPAEIQAELPLKRGWLLVVEEPAE